MKKIFSLVLIVGSIFLVGCTKTPVEVTTREVYDNAVEGFSLQYPDTRTVKENVYGSIVMFSSPISEDDTISENVGIIKKTLDKTYTAAEYYQNNTPEIVNVLSNFTELTNESIDIQGMDAQKVIYRGTQSTTDLQVQQTYIIKDSVVYIITYTATQKTFDDFAQDVDEMIASIVIK